MIIKGKNKKTILPVIMNFENLIKLLRTLSMSGKMLFISFSWHLLTVKMKHADY